MRKNLFMLSVSLLIVGSYGRTYAQIRIEKAREYLLQGNENRALEILEQSENNNTAAYLNLLGEVWLKKGDADKAFEKFETAKTIIERDDPGNERQLGETYNNMAVTLWAMGKSSQALQFHQVALQKREQLNEPLEEAASLNNIGLIYSITQPDLAIEYYERAKEIYDNAQLPDKIATALVNIGLAYSNKEQYDEALMNLDKALDIRVEISGKKSTSVAFVYTSLASVFAATKDYKFAIEYAQKAVANYKENYGDKHPEIATTYNLLGSAQLEEAQFKEAIGSFQKAILANLDSFSPKDKYEIPPIHGYFNADIYLVSILQKALAFEKLHTQFSLKIKDLEQAFHLLDLADKLIDKIRQFRTNEADKIALGNVASDVYEAAIRISLEMAEVKWKKLPYSEKAFYFADKSKSAVLLEAIADANAQSFAGIPNEMLIEEKEIKREIAYLEQKLAESMDDSSRKPLNTSLLEWNQSYVTFKKTLETNYPEYYILKYNIQTPSLADIQAKLKEGTTMVSYFIGTHTKRLYVFFVNRKGIVIENLALKDDFNKNIIGYRNAIYYKLSDMSNQIGFQLYTQLGLAKLPKNTKQIIFVPAGRIATIPLEALITQADDPNSLLINKYAVSYVYAASLMHANAAVNKKKSVALFAPVNFKKLGLSSLPGSKTEVERISSLFKSKNTPTNLFVEADASKSAVASFKVANSNILHFATHGIVDEMHPERSQICLTTKDGSNGRLFTGDIYNLSFNADLVVLSACETGLGKLSKGEGIIGLTRAIIYSGVDNLIVTLWRVADVSTSQLMTDFYSNMLSGQGYSQALANAKRKMIKSSSYSESYYWAPFVLIGR